MIFDRRVNKLNPWIHPSYFPRVKILYFEFQIAKKRRLSQSFNALEESALHDKVNKIDQGCTECEKAMINGFSQYWRCHKAQVLVKLCQYVNKSEKVSCYFSPGPGKADSLNDKTTAVHCSMDNCFIYGNKERLSVVIYSEW